MKKIITHYFLLNFIIIFISCQNDDFVEFKITNMNNRGIYIEKEIDSELLKNNIEIVLKTYDINYFKKNNKIFIEKEIFNNKEYLSNLGKKAKDSIWIKNNRL